MRSILIALLLEGLIHCLKLALHSIQLSLRFVVYHALVLCIGLTCRCLESICKELLIILQLPLERVIVDIPRNIVLQHLLVSLHVWILREVVSYNLRCLKLRFICKSAKRDLTRLLSAINIHLYLCLSHILW